MEIHKVKKGETVYSIAREYGVSPAKIIENNGLKNPDKLAEGRELLILFPTRTYTARRGDTLDMISKRFSVSRSELMKNNPTLRGRDKIYPEEVFAVRYPNRTHGIALLCGYLYSGCQRERLMLTLPYLSHLALSSYVYDKGRLRRLFDTREAIESARSLGKNPLVRIYCRPPCSPEDFGERFIRQARDAAISEGCDGIVLSAVEMVNEDRYADFLFEMKKELLSEGLTLWLETNGKICPRCLDTADSVIICAEDSLAKGADACHSEAQELYRAFAQRLDTSNAFIDLSPFAYKNGEAMPIDTALSYADSIGAKIDSSQDGMLLKFNSGKDEIILPSKRSIKAKLDLVGELGYLGCAIDIMRCPVSHLMMLSSLFHLSPDYFSGGI